MGILNDDMKQLVSGQLGFIATVDEKGWPDIAAKGTLRALDDSTLVFAEIAGKRTYQNIIQDSMVAVAVVDRVKHTQFRCVGKAEVITEGKLFDEMAAKLTQQGRPKPKAIIKINVIEVR